MQPIFFGGPWYRATHPKLTVSAMKFAVLSPAFGYQVHGISFTDGMLDVGRNILLERAMIGGATWFLSADADVSFDNRAEEICRALDEAPYNAAVVGAPLELPDGAANVVDEKDNLLPWIWLKKDRPMFRVNKVGFGLVAFRLAWYEAKWPKTEAYFQSRVARVGSSFLNFGEDYNHCQRVRELGGEVWCDPRIGATHEMGRTVR